jgi:hypothetical protein
VDRIVILLKPFVSPWLTTIVDWISALPEWMKDSKTIEIVLFLLIVQLLRRQRTRLSETVNRLDDRLSTFQKMIEALRLESETVSQGQSSPNVPDAGPEFWDTVRALWATTRSRIELAIQGFSDGRTRRRYANMDRYTYRDIIFALTTDKVLTNAVADKLLRMSGMFFRLRANPQNTTRQDAAQFETLYRAVSNDLPKEPPPQLQPAKQEQVSQTQLGLPELEPELPGLTRQSGSQLSSQRANGPVH